MSSELPNVLILTPVKDASSHLDGYFSALERLTYPSECISLGLLESDSADATHAQIEARLPALAQRYASARLWKRDFGLTIPAAVARWNPGYQLVRRCTLARARNHLLFRALDDQDWVLWIDVDVVEYPASVIETLLATQCDIVHPHCVKVYGGDTFDRNAWRDHGTVHMDQLRGGNDLVRLDAVGGSMLLVKADRHRDGLVFPPFPFGRRAPAIRDVNEWLPDGTCGECETEGLGIMAKEMGLQCWGMPNLEILHKDE